MRWPGRFRLGTMCANAGDVRTLRRWSGVALVCALAFSAPARAASSTSAPLPESGLFHAGFGVEPFGIGPVEAISKAGVAYGFSVGAALQFDLGPRFALRIPAVFDFTTRSGNTAFGQLALSPGALYRFRDSADQRWIPYVGAGLRLAAQGVHRDFVGEPLVTTTTAPLSTAGLGQTASLGARWKTADLFDEHHSGHSHDPNLDAELGAGPELWAGLEYHATRLFALDLNATYAWVPTHGTSVHVFRETLLARFTF